MQHAPRHLRRQRGDAGPAGQPRREGDPCRFAHGEARADGAGRRQVEAGAAEGHAGVREREDRHHHERAQAVQCVFETQQRGRDGAAGVVERVQRFLLALARDDEVVTGLGPVEILEMRPRVPRELGGVDARVRGNRERQHDAGNRRVDARLVHEGPQREAGREVGRQAPPAPARRERRQCRSRWEWPSRSRRRRGPMQGRPAPEPRSRRVRPQTAAPPGAGSRVRRPGSRA